MPTGDLETYPDGREVRVHGMQEDQDKQRVREVMDIEVELPCRTFRIDDDGNRGQEYVLCARSRVYIDRRGPDGAVRVVDALADWAGRDEIVMRPLDSAPLTNRRGPDA